MPNTALQTKATLIPYPGCRGDQRPYWKAGKIPTCAKNKPNGFHKIVYLRSKKITTHCSVYPVAISALHQDLMTYEHFCVKASVYFVFLRMFTLLKVSFVFGPLRLKESCLSLNSPLFTSGEAICDITHLYGEKPRPEQ